MKTTVSKIIKDVCQRIGEAPSSAVSDSICPTLDQVIAALIEQKAREAVLSTPRVQLTGWRNIPTSGLQRDSTDGAILPLPDDFLLLMAVWLDHWEGIATEIIPPDCPRTAFLHSRYAGLRPTSANPMAIRLPAAGRDALRLFPGGGSNPSGDGWYMPAPKIDSAGNIEIPDAAYDLTVKMIIDSLTLT